MTFPVAFAVDESDFRVMDEAVYKGGDACGSGEDGGPVVEGEVCCDDDGFVFVSPGDDLKDEVSGPLVVGQIAYLIDAKELGFDVVFESAF